MKKGKEFRQLAAEELQLLKHIKPADALRHIKPTDAERDGFVNNHKKDVEGGNNKALLMCLFMCIAGQRPIPPWLREAYISFYLKYLIPYDFKSWDEVFGGPPHKGRHRKTERRKREIAGTLFNRVEARHEAGEPISKGLFESVGEEFEISGTVAGEIYYEHKKVHSMMDCLIDAHRANSGNF